MKIGVSVIFLLLIFTSCFSLNNLTKNSTLFEENSLSLSAAIEDSMEDNDNYWDATWVTPSYYSNLAIIENDEDWFYCNICCDMDCFYCIVHFLGLFVKYE